VDYFDKGKRKVERNTWLKEMQRDCEVKYDGYAALYWDKYGLYNNATHLEYLREFLGLLSQGSRILDAACGAGRYLPQLLETGHSILGIDQSQGMLDRAREKFPGVALEKISLQDMTFREEFEGVICMDAIENVPPEDWSLVLRNFHQALSPHGCLYFTVETMEMAGEQEIKEAFKKCREQGLPVVHGEVPDEGVYHFHPTNQRVREWAEQAGFEILKEGDGELWYHHILLRKTEVGVK
jgi:2-polyprenyl-3-methyl-5-hydroxy-6-metoxy-1,4-benzoquinol methylase